ncbi:MAG: TonB-dependent receptor [Chthoniobacterales bacterium]|nr:TonB-dependent receptor [Chthoniobacterales bacterium]
MALASLLCGKEAPAQVEEVTPPPAVLKKLSVEELMDIDITSVSKYPEKLSEAAGAIAVLTQQDIARSGVTSIPEALRLVPGVDVARVDAHTWAISSRGFNDVFANKLLVLIDGRTIYTPLFSGVFWDVQDTMLQDIDRIEVVRGPGATLWGANAVNGVINIITKGARETQGLLVSAGGGTEDLGFTSVRYGVQLGSDAFLRVYGKYSNHDSSVLSNETQARDAWDMYQGGFRFDWEPTKEDIFTLQGDLYSGHQDQRYAVPTTTFPFAGEVSSVNDVAGGNLLGRWSHNFSDDSQLKVQAYYDRTVRETAIFGENRDTGDFDVQHRFALGDRQEWIWGLGFRATHDDITNSLNVSILPNHRTLALYSAFLQDEITLVPERLRLTLGSKFEHNDFTGFEIQPSGRLSWTPGHSQTFWAAISRAVRTPSRSESDIRLNPAPPVPIPPGSLTIFGNPNMVAEELLAYEVGYRVQPIEQVNLDLTAFYNDYSNLRSLEPLVSGPVSPSLVANEMFGESYGAEISLTAQVTKRWRLQGSYSYLNIQLHRKSNSRDTTSERTTEGSSPRNQFFIRSLVDLGWNLQFDSTCAMSIRYRGRKFRVTWRSMSASPGRPARILSLPSLGKICSTTGIRNSRPPSLARSKPKLSAVSMEQWYGIFESLRGQLGEAWPGRAVCNLGSDSSPLAPGGDESASAKRGSRGVSGQGGLPL